MNVVLCPIVSRKLVRFCWDMPAYWFPLHVKQLANLVDVIVAIVSF